MPAHSDHPPISRTLLELAGRSREKGLILEDVITDLGARASGLIVVLMAIPFCGPVSIPGLSTPGAVVIFLLSMQWVLKAPLWLPARVRRLHLPPAFFAVVFKFAGKMIGSIEKVLKPRWPWFQGRVHGVLIALAAVLLALPLPPFPPFTNMLPAWVVVLGMLGILEEDGVAIAAAWLLLLLTAAYFTGIILLGAELVEYVKHWLHL